MSRILVTGATGRIGREVVRHLLEIGAPVRALTRHPDKADLPAGVEVVPGDLTAPESLDAGLRDVAAVFLLWTAPPATAPAVVARLAETARRVVLLSSPHQTPHPFFQQPNPMAAFHAELERLLAESRLASTILRPGMFASNAGLWWAPQIRQGDVVRWPYASVETAPVDERDIAAVAARALTDDRHAGGDYVLTGPEALSHAEQLGVIGDALGRRLRYVEMSPDEFRQDMAGRGAPAAAIDMLLNAWQAASGIPAYQTSTVADILGRPARPFRQWAEDHAEIFRAPTAEADA
jgi:uncharacterized protein YbjT (DUF2867 family)